MKTLRINVAPGGGSVSDAIMDAFAKAAEARREGKYSAAEIVIPEGEYFLDKPMTLGSEQGGSVGFTVTLTSAGTGASLIGGVRIPASSFKPVNDRAVRARFEPQAAPHIRVADLRAAGISDFGTLRGRGFSRPSNPAHLELYCGEDRLTLARWPRDAWARISTTQKQYKDEWGQLTGDLTEGFHYDGDRPDRWAESPDIWVHGYWGYDWANSYEHVKSIDKVNKKILTYEPYGLFSFRPKQRFYFLNILEEITGPGDYYVDTAAGLLYVWPLPAMEAGAPVTASVLEQPVFTVTGARNLTLSNMMISSVRGAALEIKDSADITVSRCIMKNIGNYAVVSTGCTKLTVEGCELYNTGDGGINITAGNREELIPSGCVVRDNHIHDISHWSRCYVPGILFGGCGLEVRNNIIHDAPHTAILFMGSYVTVEQNEIYSVCLETGDAGTIYTGRDYTFRGNAVRHNYLHHIGGYGVGTMGIYNDDCVSGTEMTGNLFQHVSRAAFMGGGVDLSVKYNVFVQCRPAVEIDGRGASTHPVWRDMVDGFMKKGFYAMNPLKPPYSKHFPELKKIDAYYSKSLPIPPDAVIESNISYGGQWLVRDRFLETGTLLTAKNLVDQDPSFEDPDYCDFRVKPDSKAFTLGFVQHDYAGAGLSAASACVRPVPTVRCSLKKSAAQPEDPTTAVNLTLYMKNTGAIPASGVMKLYSGNLSELSGKTESGFSIEPGATLELEFSINPLEKTYAEARCRTPGIRPARLWF